MVQESYTPTDATVLLLVQRAPNRTFVGLLIAGVASFAGPLFFLEHRSAELIGVAIVSMVLLVGVVLAVRPIVTIAVEHDAVVLVKRRFPSAMYQVRVRMADVAEIFQTYAYGALVLTLRTRSGKQHRIGLGPASARDQVFEVVLNRSNVVFPSDARDGAAMARAITEVLRSDARGPFVRHHVGQRGES
jgi:hypothetical protein